MYESRPIEWCIFHHILISWHCLLNSSKSLQCALQIICLFNPQAHEIPYILSQRPGVSSSKYFRIYGTYLIVLSFKFVSHFSWYSNARNLGSLYAQCALKGADLGLVIAFRMPSTRNFSSINPFPVRTPVPVLMPTRAILRVAQLWRSYKWTLSKASPRPATYQA
jgi:hypothetical protein